ncbi:unnamed protein product [Lactuca saligna]|uniref:Uncharacterized protein n=1 Tax=Lactuca saligna TaxID=75948 RepID=A0AA35ZSQ1_LACSI|nr:unnamed protein product [Lactuca saligna]
MTRRSANSGPSAPTEMAGFAYPGPISIMKTTVGQGSYENKSQVSYRDKHTGSYGRATTIQKVSAGKFQWQNGRSGTMNEYKETSTVRIGDQSGYTEVYNEQRVLNVSFNNNNDIIIKNVIAYDNRHGGKKGGYGYATMDIVITVMIMIISCVFIVWFIGVMDILVIN